MAAASAAATHDIETKECGTQTDLSAKELTMDLFGPELSKQANPQSSLLHAAHRTFEKNIERAQTKDEKEYLI